MIVDLLALSVELISAFATVVLLFSTWSACRSYGVQYLVAIPIGFGFMAFSFLVGAFLFGPSLLALRPMENLSLDMVSHLTQAYGLMFLAFTYARRTGLRLLGGSTSLELSTAGGVTVLLFGMIFTSNDWASFTTLPEVPDLFLRLVMLVSSVYLVYETSRNWLFTRKASDGFVTIGYGFLTVEQVGFMLAYISGSVGLFLGYEGRILGLFVLIAVAHVGIKRGDFTTLIKRLGLVAPAH